MIRFYDKNLTISVKMLLNVVETLKKSQKPQAFLRSAKKTHNLMMLSMLKNCDKLCVLSILTYSYPLYLDFPTFRFNHYLSQNQNVSADC